MVVVVVVVRRILMMKIKVRRMGRRMGMGIKPYALGLYLVQHTFPFSFVGMRYDGRTFGRYLLMVLMGPIPSQLHIFLLDRQYQN